MDEADHPWILVTNDDGVDSPALPPLLRALEGLGRVRTVAPAQEYSWSSKTLSRFRELRFSAAPGLPGEAFALNGSPADCATAGIHNLAAGMPALVVSGINVGMNAGLAYLLSSGTVGAAIEASLTGVPAVAFSVKLRSETYQHWRDHRDPGPLADIFERAAEVAGQITAEVLAGGLPGEARLLSVNMPQEVRLDSPRVLTGVAETRYGPFFHNTGDGVLRHRFSGQQALQPRVDDDLQTLEAGAVSISPVRFDLDAPVNAGDRARFERR